MNYSELEPILLSFKGASLSFPFNDKTPVFKVSKKVFALTGVMNGVLSINLKCDPDDAIILRSQFKSIKPGYHMNKDHWNTIVLDGFLDHDLLLKLIKDSYALVIGKLSKKGRAQLWLK